MVTHFFRHDLAVTHFACEDCARERKGDGGWGGNEWERGKETGAIRYQKAVHCTRLG